MTTLGKVLLFLNVLAAAGVAYFATDNWAKRQSLNATGLRYAITQKGLPTEPQAGEPAAISGSPAPEDTILIRLPTGTARHTTSVPYRVLKEHFTGAEGKPPFGDAQPPLSVQGELTRIKAAVDRYITDLGNDERRLAWLCGTLEPGTGRYSPGLLGLLADSFGERQIVKRLLTFPNVAAGGRDQEVTTNANIARNMLEKRFKTVMSAPNPKASDEDLAGLAKAQQSITTASAAAIRADQDELKLRADLRDDPENAAKQAQVQTAALETKAARERLTLEFRGLEAALADVGKGASRDEADRRQLALLLLSHLDYQQPDPSWQKRMMLVFGQPEYVRSQMDRLERLKPYPALLDDERFAADARFVAEYEQMKQAAKDLDRVLERQKEQLAEVTSQVAEAQKLLAQRQTYRDERSDVAKNLKAQVQALAAQQEAVESELFGIQVKVGRLLRDNFVLEDRLIWAERQAVPPTGR